MFGKVFAAAVIPSLLGTFENIDVTSRVTSRVVFDSEFMIFVFSRQSVVCIFTYCSISSVVDFKKKSSKDALLLITIITCYMTDLIIVSGPWVVVEAFGRGECQAGRQGTHTEVWGLD